MPADPVVQASAKIVSDLGSSVFVSPRISLAMYGEKLVIGRNRNRATKIREVADRREIVIAAELGVGRAADSLKHRHSLRVARSVEGVHECR